MHTRSVLLRDYHQRDSHKCTTVIKENCATMKTTRKATSGILVFVYDINEEGPIVPIIVILQRLRDFLFEEETIGHDLQENL